MSSHTMTHLCAQKVAGETFTYIKALLTLRFGLTIQESRKFKTICQKQSNGNVPRDVFTCPYCVLPLLQKKRQVSGQIHTDIGVGLSTLLVPTNWAMREPLNRGTGNRHGSTFFVWKPVTDFFTWHIGSRMPQILIR